MVQSLILSLVILGVQDVSITTSTGKEIRGAWTGINGEAISIADRDPIPLTELLVLRTGLKSPLRHESPPQVLFADGTSLLLSGIQTTDAGDLELKVIGRAEPITTKLAAIRWIRFGGGAAASEQWQNLIENTAPSDLLVVRRPSGALDQVPGIVKSIAAEVVQFDMDGQSIEAPRSRLEGLILKAPPTTDRAGFEVADVSGNVWRASKIQGTDSDKIELTTPSGLSTSLLLSQIERLSAEGNVVFLAGQPNAARNYTPDFDLGLDKKLVDTWLASGAHNERDLLLNGTGRIEYRIPDGFQRFRAVVAPDPEVTASGGCELIITTDVKELWRGKFMPLDASQHLTFDLGSARRISFEVLPLAGGSSGDRLLLKEALLLP